MLTILNRKNTTQRLRDLKDESQMEEEVKKEITYLPFDNCGHYTDLWKLCSIYLEEFEAFDEHNLKIIESKDNKDRYSLIKPDSSIAKDNMTAIHASALMVLLRYRNIVKELSNKTFKLVSDFFHELESNREYHARQLYVLCKSNKEQLESTLKPYVLGFRPVDLEELDKILYQANVDLNDSPYAPIWLLNHLMIHLATLEIKTFPMLFKEDYLSAIIANNVSNLPSNVRLLSRIIEGKKEKILELYPSSILMCYSHFYPIHLYHTGNSPL